ncbi:response regulator [Conchiformibius steedae DSM 2580]|uniref:Response regulator n=1 Tax=Conchiformibius steedae DSM 2580 TaxID=1121352 RepID=A0AAE9L071_9NEIS|nr:response regulator [Conchiformibius steedae]QMT33159.1 response regulator [Conchiformibius steedae]URD67794.1 response regulator [Conchiformibius steedae DSM 2580]
MKRLLIVDDSDVIRNKIDRDIADGVHPPLQVVGKAKNGLEAMVMFKKFQPQLVTMDLTMPEMDGLQCIKEMIAINRNVNILVISALSDEYSGLLALQYGARGFLYKPFTDYELREAVAQLLAAGDLSDYEPE